jgi:multiple sugar transport system permease protein
MSDLALERPRQRSRSRRGTSGGGRPPSRLGFALYFATGSVLSLLFVAPLVWALLRSFQPDSAISAVPSAHSFSHLTLKNYSGLLGGDVGILHNVLNSVIVALATAALTAVLALLAGYGFARFRFRGSGIIFGLILVTLMIPFQAVLTPLFLELHWMHLINSLLGLVFFYTTFNLPFGVFVMRNSFQQIPREIEECARVDGASTWTTLWRVLAPLVVPGVATTVLYAFLFSWTEFLGALTFVTSDDKFTLPVALLGIETGTYGSVNFGYLVAGSVIAMVPCIALYVALQRYYVQGLTSGAVKG